MNLLQRLSHLARSRKLARTFLTAIAILAVLNFLPWSWISFNKCNYSEDDLVDFCLRPNKWGGFKQRLKEQKRIFASIRAEHREILQRLEETSAQLDELQRKIPLKKDEIAQLEFKIEELKLIQRDMKDQRRVRVNLPHGPLRTQNVTAEVGHDTFFKGIEDSFDFSRCSITTRFPVYVYPKNSFTSQYLFDLQASFLTSDYRTENPNEACLFVSVENGNPRNLDYWGKYGRNHVVIGANLQNRWKSAAINVVEFVENDHRFDLDLELNMNVTTSDVFDLPRLLSNNNMYLLSYNIGADQLNEQVKLDLDALEKSAKSSLDEVSIELKCDLMNGCGDQKLRMHTLSRSTFALMFSDQPSFTQRFSEALKAGSVPVILKAKRQLKLPFEELVDWSQATITVPEPRLPELHFILRSFELADTLELKRKGRFYYTNYLATPKVLSNSILSYIRHKLLIPGREPNTFKRNSFSIYQPTSVFSPSPTRPPYDDEYLGPVEPSFDSASYSHNFSSLTMYSRYLWTNRPQSTHWAPEFISFQYAMPSGVEWDNKLNMGMRPVKPGSGVAYSQALGGNRPKEQFTAVIQTYNRDSVLNNTIADLHRLPYLNKVVVIWNNVDRSPASLLWPQLHCPLVFVRPPHNSLNNRFIPLEQVKTEAVLLLDDDIELKHHEIVFAFKSVWRENRDRIVGFPARHHCRYEDSTALFYNSNHTCQYSMVLTGAAFLHKEYFRQYTYHMPQIIRQKVDEWMNCEDLAMNFLVSHLTRKPPIKVTNKWTLRCPTCTDSLYHHDNHYSRRDECLRFFERVYGYNPLVYTQFRADSVLFKTRVPVDHQKCFRYV